METLAAWTAELNRRALAPISYQKTLLACIGGAIPGAERRNGRWFAPLDALPAALDWFAAQPTRKPKARP